MINNTDTATTVPADVTSAAAPRPFAGTDRDRYAATLLDLDNAGMHLHGSLFQAQTVVGPEARRAALVGLHHELRRMAGIVNHALGGWTDTDDQAANNVAEPPEGDSP